jgi:hypothetical protein
MASAMSVGLPSAGTVQRSDQLLPGRDAPVREALDFLVVILFLTRAGRLSNDLVVVVVIIFGFCACGNVLRLLRRPADRWLSNRWLFRALATATTSATFFLSSPRCLGVRGIVTFTHVFPRRFLVGFVTCLDRLGHGFGHGSRFIRDGARVLRRAASAARPGARSVLGLGRFGCGFSGRFCYGILGAATTAAARWSRLRRCLLRNRLRFLIPRLFSWRLLDDGFLWLRNGFGRQSKKVSQLLPAVSRLLFFAHESILAVQFLMASSRFVAKPL